MRMPSKRTLAVTTTVLLIAGGGAAYAFITAKGGGNGTATTTKADDISLNGSISGTLVPGVPKPIDITYSNSNAFNVRAASISITVSSLPPNCLATDFDIKGVSTPVSFAASSTNVALTEKGSITFVDDASRDQSACYSGLSSGGVLALTLSV